MDVINRIDALRKQRNWSINNLAMEAGITQSTIASILQRKSLPKIETLQNICDAFGISLAQFFLEDEQTDFLNEQEQELLSDFRKLSTQKQQALLKLLK